MDISNILFVFNRNFSETPCSSSKWHKMQTWKELHKDLYSKNTIIILWSADFTIQTGV